MQLNFKGKDKGDQTGAGKRILRPVPASQIFHGEKIRNKL
jgi:hypothetical protein